MCNEIAHFTLTLIELFVYAVENTLYPLAEVGFQFRHPLTSSPYFPVSQLPHVIHGRIIPFLVHKLARSNSRSETTKGNIKEAKRRDKWQTRERSQRGDETTEQSNEVTQRNDETTKRQHESTGRTFCPRFDLIQFAAGVMRFSSKKCDSKLTIIKVLTYVLRCV